MNGLHPLEPAPVGFVPRILVVVANAPTVDEEGCSDPMLLEELEHRHRLPARVVVYRPIDTMFVAVNRLRCVREGTMMNGRRSNQSL